MQTAHGSIDAAITAMRAGAADFVVKPTSPERLEVSINSALKIEALQGEIARIKKKAEGTLTFGDLIVRGQAMQRVISLGHRAASSNIPVLIEGESGVGKELIARAIQGESERKARPFITVNCGAIPENLVESILFGHERGSFTGAVDKRIGKFQEADGGTLFLDEIGELPLDAQVKLLRALQEGEIDPVGAKKPVKVDFRLISATNRDMIQLVKDGKFREDLYYRLNVFPIWVPPLRDRLEDVPELALHFLARFAAEEGRRVNGMSKDALELLTSYSWPGNVRQLENAMFRAVVLADGPQLTVAEFPQIAAHVEGFRAAIPPAPAHVDRRPVITGPAMLGAENTVPNTVEVGASAGVKGSLGIPGHHRPGRDPLARGHGGRHDPPGARPLSRAHDGGRQAPRHRPLHALPQDARVRPRGTGELTVRCPRGVRHAALRIRSAALLADHDARRIGVARGHGGEDRGVGDAQARKAVHLEPLVDDRSWTLPVPCGRCRSGGRRSASCRGSSSGSPRRSSRRYPASTPRRAAHPSAWPRRGGASCGSRRPWRAGRCGSERKLKRIAGWALGSAERMWMEPRLSGRSW